MYVSPQPYHIKHLSDHLFLFFTVGKSIPGLNGVHGCGQPLDTVGLVTFYTSLTNVSQVYP